MIADHFLKKDVYFALEPVFGRMTKQTMTFSTNILGQGCQRGARGQTCPQQYVKNFIKTKFIKPF